MTRNSTLYLSTFCGLALLATTGFILSGCGGGPGNQVGVPNSGGAVLRSMNYGRLVDVYAYRRIAATRADRRDVANREPVLIVEQVVIRPDIESSDLFDASGNARLDADYRFLPFDVEVGHEELLILWDDQIPPEKARFEEALAKATKGLPFVPGSFKDQNTVKRPIPVIPRNAAICLNFDRDLGVSSGFFVANPNAIQVLEFITPVNGQLSFRPVPIRILSNGDRIILDTSLIGGEANGGRNTDGLPSSRDNRTANLRIALPTVGPVTKVLEFAEDNVPELNGMDSSGNTAVIRDFRSGNVKDGSVGALADVEKPMIVTHLKMGITAIDTVNRIITINKRNHDAAIRGRIPYVDGALDATTGLALGPVIMPIVDKLRAGDVIIQLVDGPNGKVRIRAEVVMNLEVGNSVGDTRFVGLGMYRTGSDPSKPGDGGQDAFARLKVTNISTTDLNGNKISFKSNSFPLGEDCEVRIHFYQDVPYKLQYSGSITKVSDSNRINNFLSIEPSPPVVGPNGKISFGKNVDPKAAISVRFTEPMNLETVESLDNFLITNETIKQDNVIEMLNEPKPASLAIIASKLLDHSGDGTLLQLRPPLGHFHNTGGEERYWCHIVLGDKSPRDMAGNQIDIYDRTQQPVENFSISYTLDKLADVNAVGYRVKRFASQDENGSAPGSVDLFGQYQLLEGEMRAMPVSRFSAVVDGAGLSQVTRFDRGECDFSDPTAMPAPIPPTILSPGATAVLYQCAGETANGISEPHNPRGSRLQMTYREDDFGLAHRDPQKIMLDIEQMHWAPWNDMAVPFDVFDRYTLRMAHSDWRPDITNTVFGSNCAVDCFSGRSGLRTAFDSNLLSGTTYETIIKDKTYEINPNDAFRAPSGTKLVPYPKFQKSYTWRDPRLIKWDMDTNSATGFGGAHQPAAPVAVRDTTASCSSPYVPDLPYNSPPPPPNTNKGDFRPLHFNTAFVFDYGDFMGIRTLDHSPIALPLLIDFSIYPDGPKNGGSALGTNQFHIAEIGPCFAGSGYYSTGGIPGCTTPWPETRAHVSGGVDMITGMDIYVDPDVQKNAKASIITDVLLGAPPKFLWKAPPKDDHVHWAQADFVRRVSMVTFGFFDSMLPNRHDFNNALNKLTTSWPGLSTPQGIPDLTKVQNAMGIVDLVTIMDPPLSAQPVGTSVVVEVRGAEEFDNQDKIYSQPDELRLNANLTTVWNNIQVVKNRGNLLNPFYACEAYRYALANPFDTATIYHAVHTPTWQNFVGPRVKAKGLTHYVTEDRLDEIRSPTTLLLPRYLNFRIIMENNLGANPPISPSLKSFAVAFRVGEPK
jgi:hypothetical protein